MALAHAERIHPHGQHFVQCNVQKRTFEILHSFILPQLILFEEIFPFPKYSAVKRLNQETNQQKQMFLQHYGSSDNTGPTRGCPIHPPLGEQ